MGRSIRAAVLVLLASCLSLGCGPGVGDGSSAERKPGLLSAVFALFDGMFGAGPAGPIVGALRGSLFGVVVLGAPFVYLGLLTTRLPKSVFLPLLLFIPFSLLAGMPLPLWVRFSRLDLAVSLVQTVLVGVAMVRVRQRGGSWLLVRGESREPLVSGRSALEFAAVWCTWPRAASTATCSRRSRWRPRSSWPRA